MARKIMLRSEKFERQGTSYSIVWAETMANMLMTPAAGAAMSGAEMRAAGKVADKIEAAAGTVILEDAEYALLATAAERYPWAFGHAVFIRLLADISDAPTVEIAEAV